MNIKVIKDPVSVEDVRTLAREIYRDMVKGVADIKRGVIALGGEWHMDANAALIADGSEQHDVWGFNLHPETRGDAAIKYVSLINIRPAQGSRSMEIHNDELRGKILAIVKRLIPELFADV